MDTVAVETIVRAVKAHGSDAVVDGSMLRLYPRSGRAVVYRIPTSGLGRRVIIEIGKRAGVPAHLFWHPELIPTN